MQTAPKSLGRPGGGPESGGPTTLEYITPGYGLNSFQKRKFTEVLDEESFRLWSMLGLFEAWTYLV